MTPGERYAAAVAPGSTASAAEIDALLAELHQEQRRINADAIEKGAREKPIKPKPQPSLKRVDACLEHKAKTEKHRTPSIEILAGELPEMMAAASDALLRAGGIYQRGGQLVRVLQIDSTKQEQGIRRSAGSYVISPITADYLQLAMARTATWARYDGRSKSMRAADPPQRVAAALLSAVGEWQFPILRGIVSAPTVRPDGSLLDAAGYDPDSGLFGAFDRSEFAEINPRPPMQDAMRALALLEDLFSECVFAGGKHSAHSAVAVAATITAAVRHAIPMAPAFGISAHKQGSGKTTAARAIAHVTLGREPPVLALSENEVELRKTLLGILIAGDACVLVDNVAQPVDSAALCAVLTSATYSDRVLGVNQRLTVPTASTWLLTGNHLEFVGDLTTRVLLSVLDPEVERPEARPFRRDLSEYVAKHRGELLAAALTIPLAYFAAGSPAVDVSRSRFPEWDRFVRFPLIWLGCSDPIVTQDELRSADPNREALLAVLHSLQDTFRDEPVTVARIIEAANAQGMSSRPQLAEAMLGVAGEKNGQLNARRLGRYLSRHLRRIEEGMRLEDGGTDLTTCRKRFRVASVTSVTSVSPSQRGANGSDMYREVTISDADNAGNAASFSDLQDWP